MKKLDPQVVSNVVTMLKEGESYSEIQRRVGVSKGSIAKIKKEYFSNDEMHSVGRPKILDDRYERNILRKITTGAADTAVDVSRKISVDLGKSVSAATVRRALKKHGLKSAVKVKKPLLRPQHIRERLEFSQKHREWTVEDWKRVIWSDETKINRFGSDGRKWCWKGPSETLKSRLVQKTVKYGGGSIMVWGCLTSKGPGYLTKIDNGLDADLYCSILSSELMDTISWYKLDKSKIIFQHDRDPKHTAKKTKKWLEESGLTVLDWPAQSPDLNPIEHMWNALKRKLAGYERMPTGVLELWERVQKEWEQFDEEYCMRLIGSMPDRIAAVLKARGGYTTY